MRFRTEYRPQPAPLRLSPDHPIVLLGSCFSQNIATKMNECEWVAFNGVGTLYNPLSIAKVLDLLLFDEDFTTTARDSLFFAPDSLVHSWLFDTHFSRTSADECMAAIENCRNTLVSTLSQAEAIIVTFGTAWCYFLAGECKRLVANCHKMPQNLFERRRVTIKEITETWTLFCQKLRGRFPNLSVIFTVSPVRHMKDGFEGNARSKATLLLAVEEICSRYDFCHYFPAYEILTDDLRDYRFYASDLVHPSESAVEYVWEIFKSTFLDPESDEILKEGNRRYKALHHRSIVSGTPQS